MQRLQFTAAIEEGQIVLHLGGELDTEGAKTVVRLIDQSMGDFSLDFTNVQKVEDAGFELLAEAMRKCPYHLRVIGLPG